MAKIPENITVAHILKAIEEIDQNGIRPNSNSTGYDLLLNNKLYPPKYVITLANQYANGLELKDFSGGEPTNHYLERLGFTVISKTITVPKLEPNGRSQEYKRYSQVLRDQVIYEYLFNSQSHRWLDENILSLDSSDSHGYQCMGILHYLGLTDKHKGLLLNMDLNDAIILLLTTDESHLVPIIDALKRIAAINMYEQNTEEANEYAEGKEAFRVHRIRERDQKLVRDAKNKFKVTNGRLFCEACEIDFEDVYGDRGKDFIEAHHTEKVSKMKDGDKTKIVDLAMLCSNCHRIIHKQPFITVQELRGIIEANKVKT